MMSCSDQLCWASERAIIPVGAKKIHGWFLPKLRTSGEGLKESHGREEGSD